VLPTERAGCFRAGRGSVYTVPVTALWKAWWLQKCACSVAADCHPAGQPQSYRHIQRCAPFVCSTSCGQNVNTATGKKQFMESLCERNKTWAFTCGVVFKMENVSAFQLAQQKLVCARTVM